MDLFLDLWPAVLASAVGVWFASALGWMLIGHHAKDWDPMPEEDRALQTLRGLHLRPGVYGFPFMRSHKDAQTPESKAKWELGPTGLMRIWRPTSMGLKMVLTLTFFLVVNALIAYIGAMALPRGASFAKVLQVLGTVGVLAYGAGHIPNDLWFQNKPRATVMCVVDGLVYGLITGAIFGALWPGATTS